MQNYVLKIGEELILELNNLGSGGFEIFYRPLELKFVTINKSKVDKSRIKSLSISSAIPVTFLITALAKGIEKIAFFEKRPWQTKLHPEYLYFLERSVLSKMLQ
jgi:hypothetical protein